MTVPGKLICFTKSLIPETWGEGLRTGDKGRVMSLECRSFHTETQRISIFPFSAEGVASRSDDGGGVSRNGNAQ